MYPAHRYNAGQQFRVSPIISNDAFHYALETSALRTNPEYVKAVIRSYIEVKQARGRTAQQIGWKLLLLERELPQYAQLFIAVRAEKRLPQSSVLSGISPRLSRTQTNPNLNANTGPSLQEQYLLSPNNRHPHRRTASSASVGSHQTNASAAPASSSPARTASTYRPAPQAVNPEDSGELPPPPYASEDPEPEATRDLQIRLAAEAQAEGRLNLPEASATTGNEANGETGNDGHGANETVINANNTTDGGSTPTTATYAPPPGPPPTSSLQRNESRRSDHQPSTPPTDPEEARIWEESQLEEAVRLSRASERERLELEEAMRLSLAESEAASYEQQQAQSGGGGMPPVFEEQDEHDSSGPSSRRQSSYTPSGQLEGTHRRTTSDTYAHGQGRQDSSTSPGGAQEHESTYTSGMEHLAIPDTWQSGTSQGSASNQHNLMDDDFGSSEYTQPALAPQRTGAVLQSKNPFLSPGEREGGFIQPQPQGSSSPSIQFPQPHRQPSSNSLRGSPGSPHIQYPGPHGSPGEKGLPSIPAGQASPTVYESPLGPPPPSLTYNSSPLNKASLPPLPPRQGTQPQSQAIDISPNSSDNTNTGNQVRRLPPRPQGSPQPPSLPQRNVSAQMYSATNPPTSSFPDHSPTPTPPASSFFPPQPSPRASPSSAALQRGISTRHGGEDPLEMLREFHTVFLVDDSSSMAGERWEQARQALMGVAETAANYDDQGVDVYFINSKRVGKELRAAADVEELFAGLEPRGATPTGMRMEVILREYMTRLERSQITSPGLGDQAEHVKPMNLIVVTDGVFAHPVIARIRATNVNPSLDRNQLLGIAPVDDPESVLIACAKRLDKGEYPLSQVGIQFLQIGNDSDAREALQELDDGLAQAHGVRDMVDTVPFGEEVSADLIIKTLLGGINRRLDHLAYCSYAPANAHRLWRRARKEILVRRVQDLHFDRPLDPKLMCPSLHLYHVPMVPRIPIRRTTVDIGRAFELHCLRFLTEQLYMSLTQVGGANDGGVDLRGWWTIPSAVSPSQGSSSSSTSDLGRGSRRLRVLGQCKAERKALGPRTVRELEGVMAHQRDPDMPDALAILLSQSGFSPKAMIHATRSSTPLLLVHLPGGGIEARAGAKDEEGKEEIDVQGAVWNTALGGPNGLLGGKMELRREILDSSGRDGITGDAKVMARVGLWFNGQRFKGLGPV